MARPKDSGTQSLISSAVEIAQQRNRLLGRIRSLLESGNEREAVTLMREYCGITHEEKSPRVN